MLKSPHANTAKHRIVAIVRRSPDDSRPKLLAQNDLQLITGERDKVPQISKSVLYQQLSAIPSGITSVKSDHNSYHDTINYSHDDDQLTILVRKLFSTNNFQHDNLVETCCYTIYSTDHDLSRLNY